MYCDLWSQYIQVRKLFKGGNYSREETIRGNTVISIQSVDSIKAGMDSIGTANFFEVATIYLIKSIIRV